MIFVDIYVFNRFLIDKNGRTAKVMTALYC